MVKTTSSMFEAIGPKRVLLLALVLVVCCISGFISILLSHKWEEERRHGEFIDLAQEYEERLTSEFNSIQVNIPNITAYLDGNLLLSKNNFRSLLSNANIFHDKAKFHGLVLEIPPEQRDDIYTAVKVANGRMSEAEERMFLQPPDNNETYYPIIYIEAGQSENLKTSQTIQSLQGQNAVNIFNRQDIETSIDSDEVFVSGFMPSFTGEEDEGPWFYSATPVEILLDIRDQTRLRGYFILGLDIKTFLEVALGKLASQDLIFYLKGSNQSNYVSVMPTMKFENGMVEFLPSDMAENEMSMAELRYDEYIDLSRDTRPIAIIPQKNAFEFLWKQVAIGYVAAAGLIMFGLLASYFTVNWNARLEKLVHKRTIDLEKMQKRAEAANKAKSEFLANMSHELRTPLNAIIGFSDIMKSGIIKDNDIACYKDYATDINKSGTHLLEIINDILDLSKVEANKMELIDSEAHLIDMVSPALSILSQHIAEKELQLTMNEQRLEEICLKVDEKLFKQILLNLLSNAIKFTSKGGKIAIDAISNSKDGITVIIKDNGIGMREEDIPIAMTPFSQVDGGLNRMYEGTGLGLPLVKSFTELHGGTFELLSRLNFGTSAIIKLPHSRVVAQ